MIRINPMAACAVLFASACNSDAPAGPSPEIASSPADIVQVDIVLPDVPVADPDSGPDAPIPNGEPPVLDQRWSVQWDTGDHLASNLWILASAATEAGELYLVGQLSGDFDLDPGPGVELHTGRVFGDEPEAPYAMTGFLIRLNADGTFAWARNFDFGTFALGVAADPAGNALVAGSWVASHPVDFQFGQGHDERTSSGPGSMDIFLTKVSPSGDYLWSRTFGADGMDELARLGMSGIGVATGPEGEVYLNGRFQTNVDFDFSPFDFTTGTGTDMLHAKDDPDGTGRFLTRVNADGSYGWTRKLGAIGIGGVVVDPVTPRIWLAEGDDGRTDIDWTPGFDRWPTFIPVGYWTALRPNGDYDFTLFPDPSLLEYEGEYDLGLGAIDADGQLFTAGTYRGVVDFDWGPGVDKYRAHIAPPQMPGDPPSPEASARDPFGALLYTKDGHYGWTTTEQANQGFDGPPGGGVYAAAISRADRLFYRSGSVTGSWEAKVVSAARADSSWFIMQDLDGRYVYAGSVGQVLPVTGMPAWDHGFFAVSDHSAAAYAPVRCTAGATQACGCRVGSGPHTRSCEGDRWGPCECPDPTGTLLQDRRACERSCAELGANCGIADDGCGGTVACGTCTAPQVCGADNVCRAPTQATLATAQAHPRALVADATHVYWIDLGDLTEFDFGNPGNALSPNAYHYPVYAPTLDHGAIMRAPRDGGAPAEVVATTTARASALWLFGDEVWWVEAERGLLHTKKGVGPGHELVTGYASAVSDGSVLYASNANGAVILDPSSGAETPTTLPSFIGARVVLGDAQHFYVLTADSVFQSDHDGQNQVNVFYRNLVNPDLLVDDGTNLWVTSYEHENPDLFPTARSDRQLLIRYQKARAPSGWSPADIVLSSYDPVTAVAFDAAGNAYLAQSGGFMAQSRWGRILRLAAGQSAPIASLVPEPILEHLEHPFGLLMDPSGLGGAGSFFVALLGSTHWRSADGAIMRVW